MRHSIKSNIRRELWDRRQRKSEQEHERNRRETEQANILHAEEAEYCRILGISPGATEAEITAAWRHKCLLYHPDKNPEQSEWAHMMFLRLNDAYEHVILTAPKD